MLPDTLRLADYELGHDDRAKEAQPVASVLGPRYLPWQLEQEPEASWEECRRHAELIEQIVPPPQPEPPKGSSKRGGKSTDKSGDTSQLKLALMEDI
jgi:hypothetical protein